MAPYVYILFLNSNYFCFYNFLISLYFKICELIARGAVDHWDEEQKMAYTSVGDQWYGYGTPRSMKEKVCSHYENTRMQNTAIFFHM